MQETVEEVRSTYYTVMNEVHLSQRCLLCIKLPVGFSSFSIIHLVT